MVAIGLVIGGSTLLLLAVHPFITYPLSLRLLAAWRPHPIAPGPAPKTAALCLCAYNEERVIRDKALNMLAVQQAVPGLDLLIYVDAGTDATAQLLAPFADRIRIVVAPSRTGKTVGMNRLIAMTNAECLVFSDANVTFAPDAVQKLLLPFGDPAVGVVCGHLRYKPVAGSVTAATGSAYWRLEEAIKRLESATGSVMGADGSIFAMRRVLHRSPPADLIDDMYVSLHALCDGARIVRADDALAVEEQVSRPGEEFRRKVRIACQAINVHRTLWRRLRRLPGLDLYKYVSHKLLRWIALYSLVSGLLLMGAGLAVAGAWWLLALGAASVVGALWIRQTRAILAALTGTAFGIVQSFRGKRFQTWEPPQSTRMSDVKVPS